jgi:hypothetical protein
MPLGYPWIGLFLHHGKSLVKLWRFKIAFHGVKKYLQSRGRKYRINKNICKSLMDKLL